MTVKTSRHTKVNYLCGFYLSPAAFKDNFEDNSLVKEHN